MSYQVNRKTVLSTKNGFLKRRSDWNQAVAQEIAKSEGITLTTRHWDIIDFLRTEYYANAGKVPRDGEINHYLCHLWKAGYSQNEMYHLFPGAPTRQGTKIAGLPDYRV